MSGQDRKKRVFIADDNFDLLKCLKEYLSAEGFEVYTSDVAREVIPAIKSFKPDIILLDVLMPNIDGFEICALLNNDPRTKGIPIIIISSLGGLPDVKRAYHLGVIGYFPKPFEMSKLVKEINKTLAYKCGFTLIELMLVVIIIGTLAAMVMPRLVGRGEQARITAAQSDISANIATALKLYELDNGSFPSAEEGLNALLNKPASARNWNGPYLERKPQDPWGREYQYKSPGTHRTDYDLYSLGKDGQESADDVKNWE